MSPERMGGDGAVLEHELTRAERAGQSAHAVILVEGVSDQRALEALARRRDLHLDADGVVIIPTAGATNFRRFLEVLGPEGHDVSLAGLCDEGEEADLRQDLKEAGLASGAVDLETLGFFVCRSDLEDELIRALGAAAMERLIESQGHIRKFRSFQNQPAQRHKSIEQQIWRWLGNHKIHYAPLMVDALDLDDVPAPLRGPLDHLVRCT